jgi:quercetin dioxygenase-like cupin family protein
MVTTLMPSAVLLTSAEVAALPAEPLDHVLGLVHRVLWRDGTSYAGVLTVAPGYRMGAHTHRVNHHHIWVVEGHAEVLGHVIGPGSYVHVPAGVEHDIDASGTEGCTVFYLYVHPGT